MLDLSTKYLGLNLRTPLVPSASPLCENLAFLKQMEDAGASAVVLHSLFEEQIRLERHELDHKLNQGTYSYPEALTYFSPPAEFSSGPEIYLQHLERAKKSLAIPVIASLNGSTFGGWTTFSKQIEQAGADALELNFYSVPTDSKLSAEDIEQGFLTVLASVKAQLRIPVAVKLSPYFTNLAQFARRLDRHGADGLVLFNRFYQPDIDLDSLQVSPNVLLSTPMDMRLPLRWIALLHGRIQANLAATSGIHRGSDAIKLLMAGADVTMLCSVLLKHGVDYVREIERGMREWMEEHEYDSVAQLKGCMSQEKCPEPAAFERAQYIRALRTYPASST
jgi:dihydroorotate dehydrogenase (fumarate)